MATFRLTVTLGGGAKNMYTIIGSAKGTLSVPAAYQTPNFGVNFGGVKKGIIDQVKAAGYDSWLTVGITDGSSGLGSAGINWKAWTASKGMTTKDGGVFWMNPAKSTAKGTAVVAQLTVAKTYKGTVQMGVIGTDSKGQQHRTDKVSWSIGSGGSGPSPPPPPPVPGGGQRGHQCSSV